MKKTYYDILRVGVQASSLEIEAAYLRHKRVLDGAVAKGSADARNELIFLEQAYSVLSSRNRRAAYDESLARPARTQESPGQPGNDAFPMENPFLGWWADARTARLLVGVGIFAALTLTYKFMGQYQTAEVATKHIETQANRDYAAMVNDARRVENERMAFQGILRNQAEVIERSRDLEARDASLRMKELEYRATATSQMLEMEQQRMAAELERKKRAQEHRENERRIQEARYERERQDREARLAAANEKRRLCNIYLGDRRYSEARAEGCF